MSLPLLQETNHPYFEPLQIPKPPQNSLNQFSFEKNYRVICNHLLEFTHSRSLLKGQALHSHIIKSGVQIIPLVSHHLINLYSKIQRPREAQNVFHEAPFKSATTWSSMISAFAQNELPLLALSYFRDMLHNGLSPDDYIFPCATKACGILNRIDIGMSMHCFSVKNGFGLNVFVGSSLVDMYAKCGELVYARKLFDQMPDKNVVSWSGMIYGYAQMGEANEALLLFKRALEQDLDVNDFTFSSVLGVCGNSTFLELGRQMHALCVKMNHDGSCFIGSSLVSLYSKCGVVQDAYQVFDELPMKNLGAWNAMLNACAQHGHTDMVFQLFSRMGSVGMKPNFITFLCLLYACSHAGLVKEGRYYFGLMKEYGIEPGYQHYASLVDLLGRAGKLQEAVKVIDEMPIQPTESVWGALLTGCRIHGNTELAAYAADRVFELDSVSSGIHVILSNAYAAAGRYVEAAKARKMLRDQGVKKETGLSWVEEGNKVHTFAAGDRSHSRSKDIYKKLEELEGKMEQLGYVADTSHVFREVGSEEKSETIRFHSERIAIAFSLITFPPERPIRVMKNLRICGDCHTAIKFMSKCTERLIIVRDNKRFHHFADGKCSCGDYW